MSLAFRSSFLAAALAIPLMSGTALAQSTRDTVVKAIEAGLKQAGATNVVIGTPSGDDSAFTLSGLKATLPEGDDGKFTNVAIATMAFKGVKPATDGYTADEISVDGLSMTGKGDTIQVTNIKLSGYAGKSAAWVAAHPGQNGEVAKSATATGIVLNTDGKKIPIASAGYTADNFVNGVPSKASWSVQGIVVPVDKSDSDMKDIAALGYTQLAIDLSGTAAYDAAASKVVVQDVAIQGKDMGSFRFSFTLSNVTPEAVAQLKAAGGDSAKMMEILQGFAIDSIMLRLENASLAERLLDSQAKAAGVPRDQLVQQLSMMAPMMLSSLNNKPFEKKVSDAVGAFLKTPKSLTATAKPAQPVPVAQVVGTAMVAPQTIPNVLAVDVLANN